MGGGGGGGSEKLKPISFCTFPFCKAPVLSKLCTFATCITHSQQVLIKYHSDQNQSRSPWHFQCNVCAHCIANCGEQIAGDFRLWSEIGARQLQWTIGREKEQDGGCVRLTRAPAYLWPGSQWPATWAATFVYH